MTKTKSPLESLGITGPGSGLPRLGAESGVRIGRAVERRCDDADRRTVGRVDGGHGDLWPLARDEGGECWGIGSRFRACRLKRLGLQSNHFRGP